MSKEERNKATISRLVREVVISGGDLSRAGEFIREDYIQHGTFMPEGFPRGLEGWKQTLELVRRGFPDLHGENVVVAAEDNIVVNVARVTGTHVGGGSIDVIGIHVNRLDDDGKIAEQWSLYDNVAVMEQLGALADVPVGVEWFGLPQPDRG